MEFISCKIEQSLQGAELQEIEAQKDERIQEISIERTHSQYVSVNSRRKAIYVSGKSKAFCRQEIPEPNCARKETIDIDILVTSTMVTEKSCSLSE